MQNHSNNQEIVLRRESYFSDAAFMLAVSAAMVFVYKYYSGLGLPLICLWAFLALYGLKSYASSVTVSRAGVAARSLIGGWSFRWSEIHQWNALIEPDDIPVIRFTAGDNKTYKLPSDVVDERRYRLIEDHFRKHCGAPTKVNSWLLVNAPDE